ncbi:MAG: hypothetical protein JWL73_3781 [Actinomycetia bacterium]|nr:hypothetical protein [Actinomycetes bacterium]
MYLAWRLITAPRLGDAVTSAGPEDDGGGGALRLVEGLRAEGNAADLVELDLVDVDGIEAAVAVLDVDGIEVDVVEVDGTIELVEVDGVEVAIAAEDGTPAGRPEPAWVAPLDDGSCPIGFEIKAKLSSGIFHAPGGTNYDRAKADRCYSSVEAAELDGLRPPKR